MVCLVSLNRTNLASREPHIKIEQDLRSALDGTFTGNLGEILDAVTEEGKIQYAVVEVTTKDLANVTGHHKLADLQKDYAQLATNVRTRLAA